MSLDFTQLSPEDFTDALRHAGSLVRFHASSWQGTVADFKALESVRETMGAKGDIGSMRKKLLANNDAELKALQRSIGAARNHYYRSTAHWSSDPGSPRLLANEHAIQFITDMHGYKSSVQKAKEEFIAAYPEARDRAMADLGQMADPSLYPAAEDIAARFRMSFDFEPVPDSGGFRNMPPNVLSRLSVTAQERAAKRLQSCFVHGLRDVEKALENVVDRLGDDEKVFRNTLIDNAVAPARAISPFNILDDAKVTEVTEGVLVTLTGYDLNDIRNNKNVRKAAHDDAKVLLDRTRELLGEITGPGA